MSDRLDFLRSKGEVGALLDQQRRTLKTQPLLSAPSAPLARALRMLLAATAPTCLFWGKDAILFYNDAFLPEVSAHPQALGQAARKVWGDQWEQRGAQICHLLEGRSMSSDVLACMPQGDMCMPVFDDTHAVVGVLQSFPKHFRAQPSFDATLACAPEALQMQVAQLHQELAKIAQASDKFVSVVSHELRTPLTALSLRLQRMQMAMRKQAKTAPPEPRLEQFLEKIDENLARMNQMIDAMVDAMRIGNGQLQLHMEPLDLVTLLHQSLADSHMELEQDNVQVSMQLPSQLPMHADAMRMQQVFAHLFDNVTRYAPGGKLTIGAQLGGAGSVRLWFCDNGPGVDVADVETIFEKFTQVKPTHTQARRGRLGLGLYMVRQIVEKHQGAIYAQRREPQGLRVVMEFPGLG